MLRACGWVGPGPGFRYWSPDQILDALDGWLLNNPSALAEDYDEQTSGNPQLPSGATVLRYSGSWRGAVEAAQRRHGTVLAPVVTEAAASGDKDRPSRRGHAREVAARSQRLVAKLTIGPINIDYVRRRAQEISPALRVRRDGEEVVVEGDREHLRALASKLPRHYRRRISG